MRHGTSSRRSRSRGNGSNGGNNSGRRSGGQNSRSQVFDSNGPEVRIRGTSHQICEKYLALAKDARGAGDEILAESYLQHAEHYQRQINIWNEQNERDNPPQAENTCETYNQGSNSNEDDLSLPASILGKGAETENEDDSGNVRAVKKEILESA